MPLQLEIVTPERLAYEDDGRRGRRCPAARASSASCRTTRRSCRRSASASCGSGRAATEESFAIVGGFLQVRPDKVVVMAETADMASEIDLEKAQEARREAERALESGYRRGRRPGRRPGRAPGRRCSGSASPSGATARGRGAAV